MRIQVLRSTSLTIGFPDVIVSVRYPHIRQANAFSSFINQVPLMNNLLSGS